MYKGSNPNQRDQLRANGGVVSRRGVKITGQNSFSQIDPALLGKAPRIYKPYQQSGMGPLGDKPERFTLYDLLMSNDEDDKNIIENYFEDWQFPELREVWEGTNITKYVLPETTIMRYQADTDEMKVRFPMTKTQYLYILVNMSNIPVAEFGTAMGMPLNRMRTLVCVYIGDPTSGYLGNSYIEYAVRLNTPIKECVTLTAAEYSAAHQERPDYFYKIQGDVALEKEIYDKWFNTAEHFFNSTIYPKIRQMMGQ